MRITKYTHACVRISHAGRTLVIDPGIWSEPHALFDADAILVTHEHADHVDRLRLAGLGVPVYAPAEAAIRDLRFTGLQPGDAITVAGFRVRVVGGRHAYVAGVQPRCANLGYVVEDRLYHPGDSLHVPEQPVDTLLVPMQASWLKTTEAIDFVRKVAPRRAHGIHEGQLNERGIAAVNKWLAETEVYTYLAPGESPA